MAEATSNFPNEGDAIDEHGGESQVSVAEVVIKTGADAAEHLHSAVTVRSIVLATAVSGFQAVMSQIYTFKPTVITVSGTFIVLISYFVGNAWARFLPRSDKFEAGWREKIGQGKLPWWISVIKFVNNGPWSLKEHSVCAITATSASNASVTSTVFAAQNLFYDLPLSATTVILSTISIGLFGYGLCGIMRPIAVWHVESVYWNTLPTVNTLHGLHWQEVKNSKPLRLLVCLHWYESLRDSTRLCLPMAQFGFDPGKPLLTTLDKKLVMKELAMSCRPESDGQQGSRAHEPFRWCHQ
ncbi:hypothetical protein PENSUB_13699 [Penicillium subrubescens]|uniref:Uncharacterized protein n=1 Tax=Penicillium subrubescens TaxID=1316194 RepID=A0A1Q5SNY5_9EURO|nr:hypothetical protein PENSUB_13699 [Penicillium subrubescens]